MDDNIHECACRSGRRSTTYREKYEALYNGEMLIPGEKRLVLHQLTRGQLGDAVVARWC